MSHTSHSRVFSSAKILLALVETMAECHIDKSLIIKGPNRLSFSSFFGQASSIMTEAGQCVKREEASFSLGYCT